MQRYSLLFKRCSLGALAIATIVILGGCNRSRFSNGSEAPKTDDSDVPAVVAVDDKIISRIAVTPSEYTGKTGELIDLSEFIVEIIYESGTSEVLNSNAELISTNPKFEIVENTIIISDNALTADIGIVTFRHDEFETQLIINVFNELADSIDSEGLITNYESIESVVNRNRRFPSDYVPSDLVSIIDVVPTALPSPEINQMRAEAFEGLKMLFDGATEQGYELMARSGYRSNGTQNALYTGYVASHGQAEADKFSAKPGHSEHQTGLTMDITSKSVDYLLKEAFGDTEEGIWVAQNGHNYGFVIRYPKGKEDITGYNYEPWHLRYFGVPLATEIFESGLTAEEYFEMKKVS